MPGILSLVLPVLAVAAIYCIWYRYSLTLRKRQRELCERVAQLVLAVATRKKKSAKPSSRRRVKGEQGKPPAHVEGAQRDHRPDQQVVNSESA